MKSPHSNSRALQALIGDDEAVPTFTAAHVAYLERQFRKCLSDTAEYTLRDIAVMQGHQQVVSHLQALVARQAKQRT